MLGRPSKQWRQHFLQTGDEMVGLAGALGEVLDLVVFDRDLTAQELILAFDPFNVTGVSHGLS